MCFPSIKTKIVVMDARLSFVWEMPSFSHINMIQSFIHITTGNSPYQGKDLNIHISQKRHVLCEGAAQVLCTSFTHTKLKCVLCAYIFVSFYSEVVFSGSLTSSLGLCVAPNKLCLTCSAQYFQACLGSMLANLATMFERKIFKGFLVAMANY